MDRNIASVLIVSLVSRVLRAYELRATGVTFDETAAGFLRAVVPAGVINVIANEPDERDHREYPAKWQEEREVNRVPSPSRARGPRAGRTGVASRITTM